MQVCSKSLLGSANHLGSAHHYLGVRHLKVPSPPSTQILAISAPYSGDKELIGPGISLYADLIARRRGINFLRSPWPSEMEKDNCVIPASPKFKGKWSNQVPVANKEPNSLKIKLF